MKLIFSFLTLLFLSFQIVYSPIVGAQESFSSIKTDINTIQNTNPTLPDAPSGSAGQKGLIGKIIANIFTTTGKIRNEFLDFIDPSTNTINAESIEGLSGLTSTDTNKVLKWGNGELSPTDIYQNGGNIGIGISNPTAPLQIGNYIKFGLGGGDVDVAPDFQFDQRGSLGAESSQYFFIDTDNNEASTEFAFLSKGANLSSATKLMKINHNGNVGIGTNNPSQKLDVSGNINFTGDLYKNGQPYLAPGKWADGTSTGSVYYNGGNVGVGTNNPNSRLHVIGNIIASNPTANNHVATKSYVDGNVTFLRSDTSDDFTGGDLRILRNSTNKIDSVGDTSQFEILQTNSGADAYMTFHIAGKQAFNFGLDGEANDLAIGGWSKGANKFRIYHQGNIANIGVPGDSITDNTIDSSELQDNTITANDLAENSVGNSELIDNPSVEQLFITNAGYPRLEMRDTDGNSGYPYIDMSNDSASNYDIRMRLNGNDQLLLEGGDLRVPGIRIGADDTRFFRDTTNRIATDDSFYVRAGSPTTYLYSTNTYLGASSGDTTHLRGNTFRWNQGIIQGNGNVGVGTLSPSTKLHLSVVNGDVPLRFEQSDENSSWTIGLEDGTPQEAFAISRGETLGTDPKFVIQTNGNIGINTTSPSDKLQVNGTLKLSGSSTRINFDDIGEPGYIVHGNNSKLYFMFDRNDNNSWDDGEDDRFVLHNGRVGIGTSSPSQKLQVNAGAIEVTYAGAGNVMTLENKEFIRKMTDRGGVRIGADDSIVIGDGESPDTVSNNIDMNSEQTYITSDNTIHFYSAQQSGYNASNRIRMNGSRIDDVTCIGNCF